MSYIYIYIWTSALKTLVGEIFFDIKNKIKRNDINTFLIYFIFKFIIEFMKFTLNL
jgi:hypothetical protein